MAKNRKRMKNTKMRRTVLGTLSALFMVSALIVAAVPNSDTEAATSNYDLTFSRDLSEDKAAILAEEVTFEANSSTGYYDDVNNLIPEYCEGTTPNAPVFASEDGLFSVAYARNKGSATYTGIIVNFDITNVNVNSTLTIPEFIDAYQYENGGNGTRLQAVCGDAVGYPGALGNASNYLYYISDTKEIVVSENAVPEYEYTISPCYSVTRDKWYVDDGNGMNQNVLYQPTSNTTGVGVIQATDGKYYMPAQQMSINIQYIGSYKYDAEKQVYYDYNNGCGKGVFENATQISTLNIASNILAIGNNAFVNCQFNQVSLANKVQQIGNYAFYNCNRMTVLNLYDENDKSGTALHATTALRQIGACAFAGCTSLQSMVMPDQVQFVGLYCFANNTTMASANMYGLEQDGNNNLNYVGDGCFYNCTALQVLHLGNNIYNIDSVSHLAYDCSSLYELYLPNHAGTSDHIFSHDNVTGCSNLQTVKVPNNMLKLECGDKHNEHEEDESYICMTANDDIDCFGAINLGCHTSYPDEYEISKAFVILGNRSDESNAYVYAKEHGLAFGYTEGTTDFYEKLSENYFYTIVKPTDGSAKAALSKFALDDVSESCAFVILPDTIGPYTIGSISSSAFASLDTEYKEQIEYVYIPESITKIGPSTFGGCVNLATVRFDNSMTMEEIGLDAFYTGALDKDKDGKADITLRFIGAVSQGEQESVPYQYAMTVGNTYNHPDASQREYITYCTEFPSNLQIKLDYTLSDVDNTISDAVPTLVAIPKGAEYYSKQGTLTSVDYSLDPYLAEEQNAMATSALTQFYAGNIKFTDLTETEQSIVTATTVIQVPYGVRAVAEEDVNGDPVFAGNEDILTVQLASVEHVNDKLFEDCINLVNFSMGCSDNGTGEALGSYVFENCPALTNVTLPATLNEMGLVPFHGATSLSYVDFADSPYFTCENCIIYGLDENGAKDKIVECLRVRGDSVGTSFVTQDDFAGVSSIAPYAFLDCQGILTADMSTSEVSIIPEHCFDSCTNLYQCTLPESTIEIGACAFKDTKIRKIMIPNTFAHISDTAFVDSVGVSGNGTDTVKDVDNLIIQGYSPSTAENYANSELHPTFVFEKITDVYTVTFVDGYDGAVLHTEYVSDGQKVPQVTWAPPAHDGLLFTNWDPENYYELELTDDLTVTAQYQASDEANYTLTFVDDDGTLLYKQTVARNGYATAPPITPRKSGYSFIGWDPSNYNSIPIIKDMTVRAQYFYTGIFDEDGDGIEDSVDPDGGTGTDNGGGSDSGSGSGSGTGSGSNSNTDSNTSAGGSSSNSGTNNGSNSNGSSNNGTNGNNGNSTDKNNNNSSGSGNKYTGSVSSNGSKRPIKNNEAKVNVNKTGISNPGLVFATINGGNANNYVVKITDSEDAKSKVKQALLGEYGTLDAIKYFAMDISLYDSTGTTKLENVSGVSVTITMPIPDALLVYGGNNKAAAVSRSGQLEKLDTRFTTINGVPCMSFTATHFSPYTVYVDTNNLTASGITDATPQTGDPIAPKWFLSLGLALLSILTFLMRGSDRKVVKVIS